MKNLRSIERVKRMERDHLALPYEYLSEMDELTDEEFGQLVRGLMRYSMGGAPIPREGNLRFFAARVMAREDQNQMNKVW